MGFWALGCRHGGSGPEGVGVGLGASAFERFSVAGFIYIIITIFMCFFFCFFFWWQEQPMAV